MKTLEKIINLFRNNKTDYSGKSKDPKDYKKCRLSTSWSGDDHHCTSCLRSTSHDEYMSDVCNGCGGFRTQTRFGRSWRKIKIKGEWMYQVRYRNGDEDIIKNWY